MVRSYLPEYHERWPEAEIIEADASDVVQLRKALRNVSVAYYLIHSQLVGTKRFNGSGMQAVKNFRVIAQEEKLNRIIYLGTSDNGGIEFYSQLKDNTNAEDILMAGQVPATILQAAIIIGSGSASFEILKHIVKNFPVLLIPPWAKTPCQPIRTRDVIMYLVGVLETEETTGLRYKIAGEDVLSYKEMLQIMATLLRKKRLFLPSPVSSIKVHSYFIGLLTPVPPQISASLMRGVKYDTVENEPAIRKHIDFKTLPFKVSLLRSLTREEQDKIATRWSDAYPPAHELSIKLKDLSEPPRYVSKYSILTDKATLDIYQSLCEIGGEQGWFNSSWMWRLRGLMDRILLGVGTSRGRRSAKTLRVDDVIDFWRVEEMIRSKKLLLRGELRLPGKAWLEFTINQKSGQNEISAIAYFQPRGFAGRLYWYIFLPFHNFIFKDMLKHLSQ
jgi:uncharacterized protein YbjT (DUF2867 family)